MLPHAVTPACLQGRRLHLQGSGVVPGQGLQLSQERSQFLLRAVQRDAVLAEALREGLGTGWDSSYGFGEKRVYLENVLVVSGVILGARITEKVGL